MTSSELIDGFRSAMREAGLNYAGDILADGKLHRVNCEGEKGTATWYVAHLTDRFMAGAFGDWRNGALNVKWNSSKLNGTNLSREDWNDLRKKMDESEKARRTEEEQLRYEAKKKSQEILSAAQPVAQHLYLLRKSVEPHGEMRVNKDNELCLPLRDENGVLQSLQLIAADNRYGGERNKTFIFGGKTAGAFYTVHDRTDGPIIICEGYATGATLFEATGYAVICAMYCGNLLPVGQAMRKKYPERNLIIAADNDRFSEKNPGLEKAGIAAKTSHAALAVPQFSDLDTEGTDFNDMGESSSKEAVSLLVNTAYQEFRKKHDKRSLTLRSPEEILAMKFGTDDIILGDRLLAKGQPLVIAAQGGTGKSRIGIQMVAAIVSGRKFLAFDTGGKDMRWLILQTENSNRRLQQDIGRIKEWLGADWPRFAEQVVFHTVENDDDGFVSLDAPDNVLVIQNAIESTKPDGIIIDPLNDFAAGDLNKDADMKTTLQTLSRLCRRGQPQRAIVVLHHSLTGKVGSLKATGYDRSSFARNSKALHAWTRGQINLAPVDADNNDRLIVACGKCSNGKEFLSFGVRLNDGLIYECDPSVDVEEWQSDMSGKSTSTDLSPDVVSDIVAELCKSRGAPAKALIVKSLQGETGCTRGAAYKAVHRAEKTKVIHFTSTTKTYVCK